MERSRMAIMPANPTPSTGYLALLKGNSDFRKVWVAWALSLFGDWFNMLATATLLTRLTDSGAAIGGLFVVRMLAPSLVSPLAGVLSDRVSRRHILIATDLLRSVVVLGFLLVRDPSQIWLLYTLTFIQMALSGMAYPAQRSILPDICSKEELGAANALNSATWSIMFALGTALGGFATGAWGTSPNFIIDCGTFLLSAAILKGLYFRKGAAETAPSQSGFADFKKGLRYLKDHTDILVVVLVKTSFSLFVVGAFNVAKVAIADRVFPSAHGGGTNLGLLYGAMGLGTALGPILWRIWTRDNERKMRIAIAVSYIVAAGGLYTASTLSSLGVVALGSTLRGIGAATGWVFSTQILLHKLPDGVRGRVFSSEFALLTLANAASAYMGGQLVDTMGPEGLLRVQSLLVLIPLGFWIWWNGRTFRTHAPL